MRSESCAFIWQPKVWTQKDGIPRLFSTGRNEVPV